MVIESLETRAMLAGVGPESWSAPGRAPAPLSTGSLFSSEVILTCSSPTPGSSGTSSLPAPTAGSGGTTSGGDLWDSFSAGSGVGGSTSGSAGGVSKDGPALSSQYTGGSGVGKGSGTSSGSGGTTSGGDLWDSFSAGSGAGGSTSGSTGAVSTDGPALSSQYTGGSGAGKGSGTSSGSGGTTSGGDLWLAYSTGSGAGGSASGSTGRVSTDGPALSSQYTGGSGLGKGSGTSSGSGGSTSGGDLWLAYSTGSGAGGSKSGSTGGVSKDGPALSSQYAGGSGAGGQGNGTGGTLSNADLWRLYWSGAGAGSSSSSSDEGSLTNDPTILAQYTGGSGIGGITPLVYNPQSDGSPVFQLGVWTGDDGGAQFVQTVDNGSQNAGTDPPNRPTWDDVKDWYSGPQWQFEFEAGLGLYDSPDEESKPKDEFSSIPTDENGNYSWLDRQKYLDFLGQIVQTGKAFAWHMAEWFGPDEVARAAKPVIAGGKTLAVIGFGAGKADDVDDIARAARNGKLPRWDGKKPMYAENPAHVPGTLRPGKTPLPDDAAEVFRNAVPDSVPNGDLQPRNWYGRNAEGKIYRFSYSNDGTAHFSGIDGVGDGVRNITPYARKRLEEMFR